MTMYPSLLLFPHSQMVFSRFLFTSYNRIVYVTLTRHSLQFIPTSRRDADYGLY